MYVSEDKFVAHTIVNSFQIVSHRSFLNSVSHVLTLYKIWKQVKRHLLIIRCLIKFDNFFQIGAFINAIKCTKNKNPEEGTYRIVVMIEKI